MTEVMEEDYKPPMEREDKNGDCLFIEGLYLEGARWDGKEHLLKESRPNQLFTQMPTICLRPYSMDSSAKEESRTYSCPVYITTKREGK
jgi:dynein heavy chain